MKKWKTWIGQLQAKRLNQSSKTSQQHNSRTRWLYWWILLNIQGFKTSLSSDYSKILKRREQSKLILQSQQDKTTCSLHGYNESHEDKTMARINVSLSFFFYSFFYWGWTYSIILVLSVQHNHPIFVYTAKWSQLVYFPHHHKTMAHYAPIITNDIHVYLIMQRRVHNFLKWKEVIKQISYITVSTVFS